MSRIFCCSALAFFALLTSVALAQDDASTDPKTSGRILHSMIWTGKEALVWGGGSEGKFFNHGLRIDPITRARSAINSDGAPSGRWAHAAVWTGSKMIIWGGRQQFESSSHVGDGGLYDPYLNRWSPMATENAPEPRSQMAAVWSDAEMLVWGGYADGANAHATGGRYNPLTNTWRPMSTDNAPTARVEPQFVWTGKELLVWGGITPDLRRTLEDGAKYDTTTDRWTPIAKDKVAPAVWGSPAVWTGREMLIWSGSHQNGDININEVAKTGAAYDPTANTWRAIATEGAPSPRFFHTSVWTGSKLIVWGGGNQITGEHYNDGGVYDVATDSWRPLDWKEAPEKRGMHTAIWTGSGMLLFGGSQGGFSAFSDAALLSPQ
jgi:N-acetylneuraminic acid mutarotase